MNTDDLKKLQSRYETAFLEAQRWYQQLLYATRYAVPSIDGMNILYSYKDSGLYKEYWVDNYTPQIASDKRASNLHSLLLPMGRRWVEIYNDGQFDENLTEKIYKILQSSNIHSIIHSTFLDVCIGTGAIWIDSPSKENPIVFKSMTGVAVMPEFSDESNPENVWFKKAIGDLELQQFAGYENYKSTDNINFISCGFIKNRDYDNRPLYKLPKSDINEWVYIEVLEDRWDDPLIFETRPYKQLHLINDTIRAGESRGRGIILKMLGEIVYLNEITKGLKDAVKFKSNPPIVASEKLGNLNFANLAGGVFPGAMTQTGDILLAPLKWDVDIPTIENVILNLENKITNAFNVMPYGNVDTTPVRTATDIAAREAEAQRESLTDISRLVCDMDQMFKSILFILKKRGILGKNATDITFKNPTMDAESQLLLNNLITYKQITDQVIDPRWSSMVNNSKNIDSYLKDKLNIPSSISKDSQSIDESIDALKKLMLSNPNAVPPFSQPQAVNPVQLGRTQKVTGFGQ